MLTYKSHAQIDGLRPSFAHRLASFRSNLRANRSNNSFATATDWGVYQGGSFTLRASGTLSKNDPVDYYKLQITQGASYSEQLNVFKISSGGLRLTSYFDFGSGIIKASQEQYSKGTLRQSSLGFSFPVNATLYVKYDRPKSKATTRYEAKSFFH